MVWRVPLGSCSLCYPPFCLEVISKGNYKWMAEIMFTGLIEETGVVRARSPRASGLRLEIEAAVVMDGLAIGDSVAINGCCLTVIEMSETTFSVELVPETLALTTFATCVEGESLNLERAMRLGDRFDGHIVQGHVDGLAEVIYLRLLEDGSARLRVRVPDELGALVAHKGSVTLSGVSLTVAEVDGLEVEVALVPHTLEMTNLDGLEANSNVQIEVDVLARYMQRQMEIRDS